MDPWLIKHPTLDRWLALHGWSPERRGALRFNTRQEATIYAKGQILSGDYRVEQVALHEVAPGVATTFSPFGYPAHG